MSPTSPMDGFVTVKSPVLSCSQWHPALVNPPSASASQGPPVLVLPCSTLCAPDEWHRAAAFPTQVLRNYRSS